MRIFEASPILENVLIRYVLNVTHHNHNQTNYISIYHRLTVILSLKKGAYPENVFVLHCHIKLASLLTIYVFGFALEKHT